MIHFDVTFQFEKSNPIYLGFQSTKRIYEKAEKRFYADILERKVTTGMKCADQCLDEIHLST